MTRITTHPGEILREEFMIPLGLSANALARALNVAPNRITTIIAAENPGRCHAGHGAAAVTVFRDHAAALAEFAACL